MSESSLSRKRKKGKVVTKELTVTDASVVTKSNQLVEARFKLSLDEQRLVLLVVSRIEPDDEEPTFYSLRSADLIKALGWENDNNAYLRIRSLVRRLQTRLVFIKTPEGNNLEAQWFGPAEYEQGSATPGMIEFEISRKLTPYLLQLKGQFTSYKLKIVFRLQSAHTIRIYELLKQYEKLGERRMSLKKLRLSLGIEKLKTYRLYGNVKEKILVRAQRELSEKTDISFDFEEIKEGRKVVALRFQIRRNERGAGLFPTPLDEVIPSPVKEMVEAGVTKRRSEKIWREKWDYLTPEAREALDTEDYEFDQYVREKLELLRNTLEKKKIPNPGGWLVEALKDNWTTGEQRSKQEAARQLRRAQKVEERRIEDNDKTTQERAQKVRLDDRYLSLPAERQIAVNREVYERLMALDELSDYRVEIERVSSDVDAGSGFYNNLPPATRVVGKSIMREIVRNE